MDNRESDPIVSMLDPRSVFLDLVESTRNLALRSSVLADVVDGVTRTLNAADASQERVEDVIQEGIESLRAVGVGDDRAVTLLQRLELPAFQQRRLANAFQRMNLDTTIGFP